MELEELIETWQSNEAKIARSTKLNAKTLDLILSRKITSTVKVILWQRIIELTFHSAALVLLVGFLMSTIYELPYAISAVILIAFYVLLFVNCWQHIHTIIDINEKKPILSMQESITRIQTHSLDFVRLSVLCIPAFLSFPIVVTKGLALLHLKALGDFDLVKRTHGMWWYAEIIAYIILVPLGLWFYRQVNPENIHKKWVSRIVRRCAGARLRKAIEYLNELAELRNG